MNKVGVKCNGCPSSINIFGLGGHQCGFSGKCTRTKDDAFEYEVEKLRIQYEYDVEKLRKKYS